MRGARRARAAFTRDEIVHPRAAAFGLARVPVGVKRAEQLSGSVAQLVKLHLGVPGLHPGLFRHAQTEDFSDQLEHPRDHALHRKIGPQGLFVEIVSGLPQLLRPEGDLPRLERARCAAGLARLELLPFTALARERRGRPPAQLLHEAQRARTALRHAPLGHEVGEARLAKQRGLLGTQREDSFHPAP